jgi:glycosyltransferase involved in cell wall biosynthesis
MTSVRPLLLDVTRPISRAWSGRMPTGIDRVCDAYIGHYRGRAHAVVQHRGVHRVLNEKHSDALFDLLGTRDKDFRMLLLLLAPAILLSGLKPKYYAGKVYLNVGHTDFDLPSHWRWIKRSKLKAFYMLHDLIPVKHPNLTQPHAVRRQLLRVAYALKEADGIITNSQSTLYDLTKFANTRSINMPAVVVAHLGVDHIARETNSKFEPGEHFVCLSTIETRKNHLLLLRIWQTLIAAGGAPSLIFIGQWGQGSEAVQNMLRNDPNLSSYVTVLSDCGDEETFDWVSTAKAALLPSMAEGYGLPLAEAMALGVPVIASDLPCFREIGDSIPLLLGATDEAAWEAAVTDFIRNKQGATRQRFLLKSYQPKRWHDHFQRVDQLIAGVSFNSVEASNASTLRPRHADPRSWAQGTQDRMVVRK